MQRLTIASIAIIAGLALAGTVAGQGRHDEKPHGMPKAAAAESSQSASTAAGTGGRHDERPHGMKKAVKTKAAEPTPAKVGATQPADTKAAPANKGPVQ